MMQLTTPDIHLKYADRVFRLYIKSLGDRAVDRGEESVSMNAPIHEALQSIRNPYERLEKKIDKLTETVKRLDVSRVGPVAKMNDILSLFVTSALKAEILLHSVVQPIFLRLVIIYHQVSSICGRFLSY
ncbi:MAG: hypothetical protein WA220_05590 [Candidatus Nitrosopolaris sp.]|jgi:hypothetical protein